MQRKKKMTHYPNWLGHNEIKWRRYFVKDELETLRRHYLGPFPPPQFHKCDCIWNRIARFCDCLSLYIYSRITGANATLQTVECRNALISHIGYRIIRFLLSLVWGESVERPYFLWSYLSGNMFGSGSFPLTPADLRG